MLFRSEELWHRRGHETSVALEAFPHHDPALRDGDAEREMKLLQDVVTQIRGLRADHKIDKKQRLNGTLAIEGGATPVALIEQIANVSLTVATSQGPGFDVKLELPETAGLTAEQKDRLRKETEQLEKVIANSNRQLSNEAFVSKEIGRAHV